MCGRTHYDLCNRMKPLAELCGEVKGYWHLKYNCFKDMTTVVEWYLKFSRMLGRPFGIVPHSHGPPIFIFVHFTLFILFLLHFYILLHASSSLFSSSSSSSPLSTFLLFLVLLFFVLLLLHYCLLFVLHSSSEGFSIHWNMYIHCKIIVDRVRLAQELRYIIGSAQVYQASQHVLCSL